MLYYIPKRKSLVHFSENLPIMEQSDHTISLDPNKGSSFPKVWNSLHHPKSSQITFVMVFIMKNVDST